MPDYNNLTTKLTPGQYKWSATLTRRRPGQYGLQRSHDCTGNYTPPPGATVASFQDGIKHWYAQKYDIPVDEVYLVRCTLTKK